MLKQLRHKKTAKKIWIVLLILILPAFLFWGFGSYMRSQQENASLGKIHGRSVSLLEYKDAVDAVRNQAIMQFGDKLSEVEKYLNLQSQAWDRLILLSEAKKRRIKISDKEVIEYIKSYPFFQVKGQFEIRAYNDLLQYVFRTQPRIFEEQTRQNMMLSKLYEGLTKNISVTDEEVKKEYQKLNEKISLYYIGSSPAEFAKDINPAEEEIKAYFAQKSYKFKQPLSFNLEYLTLNPQTQDTGALTQELNKIAGRLNKNEDISKIAKDLNLEVKETGLFTQNDPIPGIGWGTEQVLNNLDKIKPGNYFPLSIIDKKYYVLKLKERKEPYIPDFAQFKDKVKEAMIKEKSQEIAKQKIQDCLKDLKNAFQKDPKTVDFDKAAKDFGLKSGSTDDFQYGSYIEGIGSSDVFWTQAQSLKPDSFTEIIDTPAAFYIVKMKNKIPMDEKKFVEEKKDFGEKLLLQKKQEYLAKYLQQLKKQENRL